MKFVLLSLFLFNLLLIVSSQSYDEFELKAALCQTVTVDLDECGYFCGKYASVHQTSSISYDLSFYLDSECSQQGYLNGTNRPFIIPFSCSFSENNPLGTDGTVNCSSTSTSESSPSKQIAISTILISAIFLLINNLF
ncbi:hypothetical protein ACTFIY_010256 [Dictyostelium cf. discoideum]